MKRREFIYLMVVPFVASQALAISAPNYSKLVYPGKDGKLIYAADENGNTIPDFSNCGYMGGGVRLPSIQERVSVDPVQGDAGSIIQAAIDRVSKMSADKDGFRGAVLIKKGVYKIGQPLQITTSGVVLRGEGQDQNGTVLIATQRKQHALIEVKGQSFGSKPAGVSRRIVDSYVPVGSHTFKLDSAKGLAVGDHLVVRRIGNKDWIHEIAMDRMTPRASDPSGTKQWEPFNMDFDRFITHINGDKITIDTPVVCAIEQRWGGGEVLAFDSSGRISNVGIENLRGDSEFDQSVTAEIGNKKEKYFSDEQHGWDFVSINSAENVWVRDITAVHFGFSAVNIGQAKWATVQGSKCLDMVSQITGSRRYVSILTDRKIWSNCVRQTRAGIHSSLADAFADRTSFLTVKPAINTPPANRITAGLLVACTTMSRQISPFRRQWMGSGHGWAGANYVAWNCEGPLVCQRPPTAQNWAIGQIGEKQPGAFAPRPDGYWESQGRRVEPRSLYLQQLEDRLGKMAVKNIGYRL